MRSIFRFSRTIGERRFDNIMLSSYILQYLIITDGTSCDGASCDGTLCDGTSCDDIHLAS